MKTGDILPDVQHLFICFLQAFIFTFLTVLFISLVATHHDDHHEHDEDPLKKDERQMDLDKIASPERITPMTDPAG